MPRTILLTYLQRQTLSYVYDLLLNGNLRYYSALTRGTSYATVALDLDVLTAASSDSDRGGLEGTPHQDEEDENKATQSNSSSNNSNSNGSGNSFTNVNIDELSEKIRDAEEEAYKLLLRLIESCPLLIELGTPPASLHNHLNKLLNLELIFQAIK
jgi:hypothetical protein